MRKSLTPINKPKYTLLILGLVLLNLAVPVLFADAIYSAKIQNRSLRVGSSKISANTFHLYEFDIQTNSSVGSIEFEYCENDGFIGEPCTAPAGFDISSATIGLQSGETGFSVHGSTTPNKMIISRVASVASPQPVTYRFDGVINPSTDNRTYFVRISTFASTDATGPRTDSGGVAFATVRELGVTTRVPNFLEFCVAITIDNHDCTTALGNSIDLGQLKKNQNNFATSQMTAGGNADFGYVISANGTTMTSGNHVIPAESQPANPSPGKSQFGINLRNNSNPDAGQNPFGPGSGGAVSGYNTVNKYKYVDGDNVAQTTTRDDYRTYTTTYVVNVDKDQPGGLYSTTINYICLASY